MKNYEMEIPRRSFPFFTFCGANITDYKILIFFAFILYSQKVRFILRPHSVRPEKRFTELFDIFHSTEMFWFMAEKISQLFREMEMPRKMQSFEMFFNSLSWKSRPKRNSKSFPNIQIRSNLLLFFGLIPDGCKTTKNKLLDWP